MTTFIYLGTFLSSLLLSLALTRKVRDLALQNGWAAGPQSKRHIHASAVPRLGGVAVYTSVLTTIFCLLCASKIFHFGLGFSGRTIAYIVGCATIVFALGVYDDLFSASVFVKFSVQIIAATILFSGGLRIGNLLPSLIGDYQFGWVVSFIATVFWVVWITNSFNLIDGLDGLAAGSALFSTISILVISLVNHNHLLVVLTFAVTGALLGFLRFNFNPATIFLGDSGSLFVGFTLSALSLAGLQKTTTVIAVAIPIVAFGLPIMETVISIVRRFVSGKPLFQADRKHIHHKLLEQGLTQAQVVALLYGISACFGLLSIFLLYAGAGMMVLFVTAGGIWFGIKHLGYSEFIEVKRVAQRAVTQKQIIMHNLLVQQAINSLRGATNLEEICAILTEAFGENEFDGFVLKVIADPAQAIRHSDFLSASDSGELLYEWRRSAMPASADEVNAAWSLRLGLICPDGRGTGSLLFYRRYSEHSMLLDIDLLISDFQAALGEAVYRACTGEDSVPEQEPIAALKLAAKVAHD